MLSGLRVSCRLRKETFARASGDDVNAPIPAVRGANIEPLKSTLRPLLIPPSAAR